MSDPVPKSLQNQRMAQLRELEDELRRDYYAELVGTKVQLLVESSRSLMDSSVLVGGAGDHTEQTNQLFRGTTCRYAPAELVAGSDLQLGVSEMIDVQVASTNGEKLECQLVRFWMI
jgi:tRNA A37 methylthiotransferase MiaB